MCSRSFSVDVRYSRILAAEEFLENMEQYESTIRNLLEDTANKDKHFPTVVKYLGLRVHLQDELIEIQRMLAENDPELSTLDEFYDSHKKVVDILRQLNELSSISCEDTELIPLASTASESNRLEARGIIASVGTPSSWGQTGHSFTQHTAPLDGVEIGTQSESAKSCHVGTQSKMTVGAGIDVQSEDFEPELGATGYDIATDPNFRDRLDDEERCVSLEFATKLFEVGDENSSKEVDILLSGHLKSMQHLRQKHEDEYRSMLGAYRESQESVQKMKAADKEKHRQKAQEKLAQRKRHQMYNAENVDNQPSSGDNTQP